MGSTPSTCWSWAGSKSCCKQRPTIARPARSSRGLYRRADEGIGPYERTNGLSHPHRGGRRHDRRGSAWRSGTRGKKSSSNASLHPDALRTIRHGTAVSISQKAIACPKARQNRSRHQYADPRRARRATAPKRARRLFLFHRARRILFLGKTKKRMGGASPVETAPGGRSPHLTPCISPLFFK